MSGPPPEVAPPLAALAGQVPAAPAWFANALGDAPQRSHVTVQGAPIECLAWGQVGDPGLLLLHGNGAHADWYSFIAPLLRAGRRVLAISFSGMGASGWRTGYSVAQWADEALAAAQAGGLFDADVAPTVVAHSFGGFALMNLAARHGQRLGQAVVVDTPIRPPGAAQARRRHRADNARSARVYSSVDAALQRFRFLPAQGCEHLYIADHIARRSLKSVAGPQGRPGWVWRFDPYVFRHFEFGQPYQDLGRAQCPVVLVRGGRSRLLSPELMARALALAPAGTRLLEVADADHHVMVDQPLAFASLLDGLAPRRAAPA